MRKVGFDKLVGMSFAGLVFGMPFVQAQKAGSLDKTFGTGGVVTTTFNNQTIVPIGAIEQATGDIVVISQIAFANDVGSGIGLTRYSPAGKLDTAFGGKGTVFTTFSGIILDPQWFALQPNGEILVAGGTAPTGTVTGANQGFGLALFTVNGQLDSNFGAGGLVNIPVGPRVDSPGAFLLQPNGKIVMGGLEDGNGEKPTNPNEIPEMLSMARYNANGTLDTTFGTGGVALLPVAATLPGPAQIALLSNGDYLAVGGGPGTVVELSPTGALATAATGAPVIATSSTAQSDLQSQTIFQPNGAYIVTQQVGTLPHDHGQRVVVRRFTEAGSLDSTFSSTPFSYGGTLASVPFAIASLPNGQLIVGGPVFTSSPVLGGLARLNSNGTLDTTFGTNGAVTTQNGVAGVLIEANGGIVAVEAVGTGGVQDGISLARFLGN